MKKLWFILGILVFAAMAQSGCTHLERGGVVRLSKSAGWVILPLQNLSETPLAAERVESILQSLLRNKGVHPVTLAPQGNGKDLALLIEDSLRLKTAKAWARQEGFRYGVTGSIQEWHYKTGLDGEPAVGITLNLIDLKNNETLLWTATASRTGWGSENLTRTTANVLIALIGEMEFIQ